MVDRQMTATWESRPTPTWSLYHLTNHLLKSKMAAWSLLYIFDIPIMILSSVTNFSFQSLLHWSQVFTNPECKNLGVSFEIKIYKQVLIKLFIKKALRFVNSGFLKTWVQIQYENIINDTNFNLVKLQYKVSFFNHWCWNLELQASDK